MLKNNSLQAHEPLAFAMRPKTLDDVVGQQHLVGPGQIIRRMVETKTLYSLILYGPAGTGKTSIASAIAGSANLPFGIFNAATGNKKELQAFAEQSTKDQTPMVVLLDEIHRLDRVKQDFLLPYMESGQLIVIGATTDNPYITIAPAIRSRAQIFEVKSLSVDDMTHALTRALTTGVLLKTTQALHPDDPKLTLNTPVIKTFLPIIAQKASGDLRTAFNLLELLVKSSPVKDHEVTPTKDDLEAIMPNAKFDFDAGGDYHYDTISALQKSIRGSDVDAALIYLARLIESGDLPIIVRRLRIIAYEDIGLADPTAADQATNAIRDALSIGLPEAEIPLSYAVIRLSLAAKSNTATKAIQVARQLVHDSNSHDEPDSIRDAHFEGAKALGHDGYLYPHDYPNHIVKQDYVPDSLKGHPIFKPDTSVKNEQFLANVWTAIKQRMRPNP